MTPQYYPWKGPIFWLTELLVPNFIEFIIELNWPISSSALSESDSATPSSPFSEGGYTLPVFFFWLFMYL